MPRYSIPRTDDVYGTSLCTLVCSDSYFDNPESHNIYGAYTSLDDAINAAIEYFGDDSFRYNYGFRIPRVSDIPHATLAYTMAYNICPVLQQGNYIASSQWERITTGGITVNNRPTGTNDYSVAGLDLNYTTYRAGFIDATSYHSSPWTTECSVNGSDRTLSAVISFVCYYTVFTEDIIIDGGIILDENSKERMIKVEIDCYYDKDLITGNLTVNYYSLNIQWFPISTIDITVRNILNTFEPEPQQDPDNDPFTGDDANTGGESGVGGGPTSTPDPDGAYDPESEPNPVPNLPTISAVSTGFITLFNPTVTELNNLASYLWGNLFDINTFKKVVADPMDCILGLSIVPLNVPSAGTQSVNVGNISTGITMTKASSQFVELDCGTIKLNEKWKAYLDWSPYTKLSIFLPYIGAESLSIDDVQGVTVGIKYHIDILSGACVAFITANGNVIAEYSGQCSVSIPITSKDFTQTIIALGTLTAGAVSGAISGGMTAPITQASIAGAVRAGASTAGNMVNSKPTFRKSGNMGGSNGLMGSQKPYLFIERPRQCAPKYQNTYTGYPSYITRKLGQLSGFTQVQDIHLEGMSCTDTERNEILELLHKGVIL